MEGARPLELGDPARLGPYRTLARLGSGGMGVVYLGRAPDHRLVAIKVIRAELARDPVFVTRFRQEVRAAAGVAGFCTARVLAADLEGELPYYVTEYVDGPTLQEAVASYGPLTGRSLRAFAVGVAEAVAAIHAAGVVHRDLKPSNVILSPDGPKVIDFGIARPPGDATLTQTGVVMGSFPWLAPEQLDTGKATAASDVFAWGGLVTFAATGRPPFGAGSFAAVTHRIVHGPPDVAGIEVPLRRVVLAALEKDPYRRPTARQVLEQLVGGDGSTDPLTAATQVVRRAWLDPGHPQPAVRTASGATALVVAPRRTATQPMPATVGGRDRARQHAPTAPRPHLRAGPAAGARARPAPAEAVPPAPPAVEPPPARDRPRVQHPRGSVLADRLPGGMLRRLVLTLILAALTFAALDREAMVADGALLLPTLPTVVALAGAALTGRRATRGFLLGSAAHYVAALPDLPGARDALGALLLLGAILVTGTVAGVGRRHKPTMAAVAFLVGVAAVQAALALDWLALLGRELDGLLGGLGERLPLP